MEAAAKTNQAPPAKGVVLADDVDSKPPRIERRHVITPGKGGAAVPVDPKMMVEKEIVDELLLVCGVIGTTTGDGDALVPVTDCLNWLQDLQRALRRDDDHFRPISLLIGKWKVVEQKLLPLVLTCRYDSAIVLTVVKILVILTKPLADSTKMAGKLVIETSSKADPGVVYHQIKLRENALEQARLLVDYKRIIAHHASHHSQRQGTGLLSIFVSLLAEPLSRSGASRTDSDHLTIELVFHLFRNLLAAEPLLNSEYYLPSCTMDLFQATKSNHLCRFCLVTLSLLRRVSQKQPAPPRTHHPFRKGTSTRNHPCPWARY
jgi:Timeless protein